MKNIDQWVALIAALSMASERLVEIIKGLSSKLGTEITDDPDKERIRKVKLQILAVVSGLVTAYLAQSVFNVIPTDPKEPGTWGTWIGLGLLASGGSGFWNAILAYLLQVKNIKKEEALDRQNSRLGSKGLTTANQNLT